jgi:hypothetical protein
MEPEDSLLFSRQEDTGTYYQLKEKRIDPRMIS